jgi:hypothetical protein
MTKHAARTQEDRRLLTALFNSKEDAERAYGLLREKGYTDSEINVMMSDETRDRYYKTHGIETELGNKALEGTGAGAAIGGTLGAIVGGVAAIGTGLVIPGLGLVVAGPIAAALAGAGAGGAVGGLAGALIGWGIPEERAKVYETGIREGGTLIGVKPRTTEEGDYFEREWRTYRGENIHR